MYKRQLLLLGICAVWVFRLNAQHFSPEEIKTIIAGDTASMLRVIQVTVPAEDKILRTGSADIAHDAPYLPLLAKRMFLSVKDTANPGVGIAAPQLGINRNIIWVQRFDKKGFPFELYLNPKIIWSSALIRKGREGCLSIPDIMGDVWRNYTIRLAYTSPDGQPHEETIEGFTAVIFQHETDHLKGILFTDRLKEQESEKYFKLAPGVELMLKNLSAR